jgi:hypothetical protein
MVRWTACLSACAKAWPPGENARSGRVRSSVLRSAARRYRRSETVWSVSSRIGAGELLSASLFANDGIELLVPLAGWFAHHSFDQQRADTDARRHYDGR